MKKRITFALVLLFASLPFAAPARAAEIMINAGSYDRNLSDSTPIDSNGALSWNMQHLYYDLKVREEGDYRAYGVIVTTGAEISAWIDGERVSTRPIPAVINSWSDPAPDPWPETLIGTWRLTPGTHQLHMHAGGLAMIYIRLVSGEAEEVKVYPKTAGAYKNAFLPAKIEGEDFDLGESGSFALGANEGDKNYRPGAKMNIYKDKNVSNSYYLSLNGGEYVDYTFNAEHQGRYTMIMSYREQGAAEAAFDGGTAYKCLLKPQSAFGEQVLGSLFLNKGLHTVRLKCNGTLPIDYIRFDTSKSDPLTTGEGEEESGSTESGAVYREIYVSPDGGDDASGGKDDPFKTVERAKNEIAAINGGMDGDIIVHLNGEYRLNEPLTLTNEHSGKNNYKVIFRGEDNALIHGGAKVTGWRKGENEIWSAPLEIEETRGFFVNGFPAQRARSKYLYDTDGSYYDDPDTPQSRDGFHIGGELPDFRRPEDLDLVYHFLWINHYMPVDGIFPTEKEGRYALKIPQPYFDNFFSYWAADQHASANRSFVFENDLILLDEPGEWYFDKVDKRIYYYPYEEEDMNSAETWCSDAEFLMKVQGAGIGGEAENLVFENIAFKYGAWRGLSETGISNTQADQYAVKLPDGSSRFGRNPAQIEVDHAKFITFRNCVFAEMEATALKMENNVKNSEITGCLFRDIQGAAISVDSFLHLNDMPEGRERCSKININNNRIQRTGYALHDSPAIHLYYPNACTINDNEISETPYSGISLGWGWGVNAAGCNGHEIAGNKIWNAVYGVRDGAHIYTLGNMPGTVIHDNYVKDSADWRGGIYFDNGSGNIKAYDNVVDVNKQSDFWTLVNSGSFNCELYENYITTSSQSVDPANKTYDNTVVPDRDWPEPARKIIEAAGIKKGDPGRLDTPEWRYDPRRSYARENLLTAKLPASDIVWTSEFMDGGEGVGYHMTRVGDKYTGYRADTEADIYVSSNIDGHYDVALVPGEWLKYNLKISETGIYDFYIYAQNNRNDNLDAGFAIYMNDELLLESTVTPTENPSIYALNRFAGIPIEAGAYELRLEGRYSFLGTTYCFFAESGALKNDEGVIVPQIHKRKFDDMAGHWAEAEVLEMADMGIINGVSESLYDPESPVTLYQTMLLAMRAGGIGHDENGDIWEQSEGLRPAATENEDIPLTRERFIDAVMRTYARRKGKYAVEVGTAPAFNDEDGIGAPYWAAVMGAYKAGLAKGDENGDFNPSSYVTRAEAAVIIKRLYDVLN